MKKILYSILLSSTFLFTACSPEDKGTSTEVVDNDHEEVNPNHINGYEQPGTVGSGPSVAYSDSDNLPDALAADLDAIELVKLYYLRNPKLSELESSTAPNR